MDDRDRASSRSSGRSGGLGGSCTGSDAPDAFQHGSASRDQRQGSDRERQLGQDPAARRDRLQRLHQSGGRGGPRGSRRSAGGPEDRGSAGGRDARADARDRSDAEHRDPDPAHADHGEGFCTFNGLVVALESARAAGRIRRALVVDLDLHYGNGTASLLEARPELHNLSIYGSWYEANRASSDVASKHAADTDNCCSIAVPNGANGPAYLAILDAALGPAIERACPDVILYQAGADPYREDPYSPLDLGLEDLAERDRRVFEAAKQAGVPIAWVLAGGYTKDVSKVVEVHANTFAAAAGVFVRGV